MTALCLASACSDAAVEPGGMQGASGGSTGAAMSTDGSADVSTGGEDGQTSSSGTTDSVNEDESSSGTGEAGVCGDGVVEGVEVCDDGVNDGAYGGCAPDCAALGPRCGDGVVDDPESCDDGNAEDFDGCSAVCVASGTVLWSNAYEGYAIEDLVRSGDGVRVALTESPETVRFISLDADGEPSGDVMFDDLGSGNDLHLHEGGRFARRGGLELLSFDVDGSQLWSFPYPDAPLLTTRRLGDVVGDGGAVLGLAPVEGASIVESVGADGTLAWQAGGLDPLLALSVDPQGRVLTITSVPFSNQLMATRYGAQGDIEFQTQMPAIPVRALIRATDHGVALLWWETNGPSYGAAKLDPQGELEWSDSFSVEGSFSTEPLDAVVVDGGDVVIAEAAGDAFSPDLHVHRVDARGTRWRAIVGRPATRGRVLETADGGLVVASDAGLGVDVIRLEP